MTLMQAPRCRSLFPHLRPTERRGGLTLAHGGGIVWGVAGHSRIARRADLIILDVPHAPARALDDAARRRVNAWYDAEVAPRLAGQEAAVVLVTPRLHRDDLTGHVLQQGGWTHLSLPALATHDETWPVSIGDTHVRRKGEVLQPAQESKDALRQRLLEVGGFPFSAQYLQAPLVNTSGYRSGWFTERRPPDWTPEMGLPRQWGGRVPEAAYILYEVFGEGPRPLYPFEDSGLSNEEIEQACILQQQRLLAACAADDARPDRSWPAEPA